MNRRNFMIGLGSLAMAKALPVGASLPSVEPKTLILLELKGGNDGLNTLVPYQDPLYYELRPRLSIAPGEVIGISKELGLHPALKGLKDSWESGDLGIIQGVGYPKPNRSHFSSIDIWESALDLRGSDGKGWIASLSSKDPSIFEQNPLQALILGNPNPGPLENGNLNTLVVQGNGKLLEKVRKIPRLDISPNGNEALEHIGSVHQELRENARMLEESLKSSRISRDSFPKARLGRTFQLLAKAMSGGLRPGVVKISLAGFDTHAAQAPVHHRLLRELGDGLRSFREAMLSIGLWNQVLVMSYSEFGRRAYENGSAGTDHGTAAPHILMGGRVRGGLYGESPSLRDLDDGDLKFSTDFRSIYQTVIQRWWGSRYQLGKEKNWESLDCIRV